MLSYEQICEYERLAAISYQRHKYSTRGQQITEADDLQWHFARVIETEVRKDDEALIRQLLDVLVIAYPLANTDGLRNSISEAIGATRARLNLSRNVI